MGTPMRDVLRGWRVGRLQVLIKRYYAQTQVLVDLDPDTQYHLISQIKADRERTSKKIARLSKNLYSKEV